MYVPYQRRRFGFDGLGDTVSVRDDVANRTCDATERRIRPVVEPAGSLLVTVDRRHTAGGRTIQLHHAAYRAYRDLKAAAEAGGIPANLLTMTSGYRSVTSQRGLWEAALRKYGSAQAARKWVAPPGGSPHHTGRAIDFHLGPPNKSESVAELRRAPAYRWMVCNASRFGFTPYAAEPWHWEYNPAGFNPSSPAPASASPAAPPQPAPAPPAPPRPAPSRPVPPPAVGADPLSSFSSSEQKALRMTTHWEGGRVASFDALTGDFDNQGLTFGMLQWPIGTGSLQPLLADFVKNFPSKVDAIFGSDAAAFREMLRKPRAEQLAWARSINDSRKVVIAPWAGYFRRLGADPDFQRIQVRSARCIMNCAIKHTQKRGLRSERALAFMFDSVNAFGGWWDRKVDATTGKKREDLVQEEIAAMRAAVRGPLSERQILEAIANVFRKTASRKWREKAYARKMAIVRGSGRVHGEDINVDTRWGISDRPHDGRIDTAMDCRGRSC